MTLRGAGEIPKDTSFARSTLPFLLVVLALYTIPIGGNEQVLPNPNEHSRILLANALAFEHRVALDGVMEVYGSMEDLAERDGSWYCDKAPGLSFMAAPVARLAGPFLPRWGDTRFPDYTPLRNLLVWLLSALPAALLPFVLLRDRTPLDGRETAAAAALLALATPLGTYATTLFSHVPAAVLVAAAWLLALNPGRRGEAPGAGRVVLAGIAGGFAAATEYPVATLVAVIAVALAARRGGLRLAGIFVAGVVVGALPALTYHQAAFGAPWATGYAFKMTGRDAAVHAQGLAGFVFPTADRLWGILLSAKRGLLFYAPIFLLVPSGLVAMRKRDRAGAWAIAAACVVYVAQIASFVDWTAGWGAAARHLVPLLPLLFIPVAWGIESLNESGPGRWIVAILAAISAGNAALALAVSPLFPVTFEAPLAQVAMRCLGEGIGMPNLISALTGVAPIAVAAGFILAVMSVTTVALARLLPSRRRWLWVPLAVALALAVSVSLQWRTSTGATPYQERVRAWYLERLGELQRADEIRGSVEQAP